MERSSNEKSSWRKETEEQIETQLGGGQSCVKKRELEIKLAW
jgi:hypothetical protein